MPRMRPSRKTRRSEEEEARRPPGADRMPTDEEARLADEDSPDPSVAEHERDMAERGARQQGEGRIP